MMASASFGLIIFASPGMLIVFVEVHFEVNPNMLDGIHIRRVGRPFHNGIAYCFEPLLNRLVGTKYGWGHCLA